MTLRCKIFGCKLYVRTQRDFSRIGVCERCGKSYRYGLWFRDKTKEIPMKGKDCPKCGAEMAWKNLEKERCPKCDPDQTLQELKSGEGATDLESKIAELRAMSKGRIHPGVIDILADAAREMERLRQQAEQQRQLEAQLQGEINDLEAQLASRAGLPDGWKLVEKKTCYALHCGNTVVATLAGPDAEKNAAIIASMLSAAPAPAPVSDAPVVSYELIDRARRVTKLLTRDHKAAHGQHPDKELLVEHIKKLDQIVGDLVIQQSQDRAQGGRVDE